MNPFKTQQRITIFYIDGAMAMTHRIEATVTATESEPVQCGYANETTRYGTMTLRGKRKPFMLKSERACFVFLEGWDLPVRADTDALGRGDCMVNGNACFNLVGNAETIKGLLEGAIIPLTDEQCAKCVLSADAGHSESLLWPEIETDHAVVNRMKEEAATI